MSLPPIANIFTVSRLNTTVRQLLEKEMGLVWISAEISNFTQPASGHWYFTLKDDGAQVRCAMFRNSNRRVTFRPQHGQQVLVRANITLYEPRGDYQLIAESMHPAGEGLLQQQFELLKAKLATEGLFDPQHKQPLPEPARQVGVITSSTGAALHDVLRVLHRRDPSLPVIIYPTVVQGVDAPAAIVRAIEIANLRNECDVLIVGRGGGSLEDLWSFNDERVARAIFASRIPIVSAVGMKPMSPLLTSLPIYARLRLPPPLRLSAVTSLSCCVSCSRSNSGWRWQWITTWRASSGFIPALSIACSSSILNCGWPVSRPPCSACNSVWVKRWKPACAWRRVSRIAWRIVSLPNSRSSACLRRKNSCKAGTTAFSRA